MTRHNPNTTPVFGWNQFKISILFLVLSLLSFFSVLLFNLRFEFLIYYSGLFLLSSFVFAIVGLIIGIRFKPSNAIELKKNRIGLFGNSMIIILFLVSLILLGIELNKYL